MELRAMLCIAYAVSVVVGGVEDSAPRAYWRMAFVSASTPSGSVVRTSGDGEGLPKMVCLVASSLVLLLLLLLGRVSRTREGGHSERQRPLGVGPEDSELGRRTV